MEWLMIIIFVVISIMDSKKKSDEAKRKHEQRRQMSGQPVYRQGDAAARERTAPKQATQNKQEGGLFGALTEFLEALEESEEEAEKPSQKAQPASRQTQRKPAPTSGKALMQNASGRQKKKAEPQTAKKDPAKLPTKTLMELRPDREKREEHTKVTASVKPLTANVKPLKNAFENDEQCEHRIELNPNIQYSKQQTKESAQRAAIVKTDGESIVQGIIWSEILGKPKAYQNRAGRVGR